MIQLTHIMQKNVIVTRIILVLLVFVVFNLVKVMVQTYSASSRTNTLEGEVSGLKTQYKELEQEKAYRQTAEYVEKEARDRLQLVKQGETVVVIEEVPTDPLVGKEVASELTQPVVLQWKGLLSAGSLN